MPSYVQIDPDGTRTTVKYYVRTPRYVTRRIKLLNYIASTKSRINWERKRRGSPRLLSKLHCKLVKFERLLQAHYNQFPQSRPVGNDNPRSGTGSSGNDAPISPPDHRALAHNQRLSAPMAQVGPRMVNARGSRHNPTPGIPAAMSGPGQLGPSQPSSSVQLDKTYPMRSEDQRHPARQVA